MACLADCELVFAFLWGVKLLGQPLVYSSLAGALLIFVGTVAAGCAKAREEAIRSKRQSVDETLLSQTTQW